MLRAPIRSFLKVLSRRPQAAGCFILLLGCSEGGMRGGTCELEQLDVTWPATIERGGVTTSERLSATLTPETVTPGAFDSLARALVGGRAQSKAVEWTVPAFDTDPGGIAVAHKAALSRGEVLQVTGALGVVGWGVIDSVTIDGAKVGVEAGGFVASDASGTIAVLETEPVALRLDVTARDSAGAAIRVRGDARFAHRRESRPCSAVAHGTRRAG